MSDMPDEIWAGQFGTWFREQIEAETLYVRADHDAKLRQELEDARRYRYLRDKAMDEKLYAFVALQSLDYFQDLERFDAHIDDCQAWDEVLVHLGGKRMIAKLRGAK